jgi:hypothetical protein
MADKSKAPETPAGNVASYFKGGKRYVVIPYVNEVLRNGGWYNNLIQDAEELQKFINDIYELYGYDLQGEVQGYYIKEVSPERRTRFLHLVFIKPA